MKKINLLAEIIVLIILSVLFYLIGWKWFLPLLFYLACWIIYTFSFLGIEIYRRKMAKKYEGWAPHKSDEFEE